MVLTAVMQLIMFVKEKNAILFTYPLEVCSLTVEENIFFQNLLILQAVLGYILVLFL